MDTQQVWALWHGGSSYTVGNILTDIETFASIEDARKELISRKHNRSGRFPCVELSTMHLYYADPRNTKDPYPDLVMEYDGIDDVKTSEG